MAGLAIEVIIGIFDKVFGETGLSMTCTDLKGVHFGPISSGTLLRLERGFGWSLWSALRGKVPGLRANDFAEGRFNNELLPICK